jgi:hypothetical protein
MESNGRRVLVGKASVDPTYTVVIAQSVYEMCEKAYMPNGVCIYLGNLGKDADLTYFVKSRLPACHVPDDAVPEGIKRQVEYLTSRSPKRRSPKRR